MVYTSEYPIISLTVDIVCLTIRDDQLQVLAVRRGEPPYQGRLALPGGFVHVEEDLDDAARRELMEETGVSLPVRIEQLASYGAPGRDPRGRTVTVAWLAVGPRLPDPVAGSDAAAAHWMPVQDLLQRPWRLSFDHAKILRDGVERARAKLEYSSLGTAFCAEEFTIADLRRVYEVVWGTDLDPGNFHRKVTRTDGFVEATGRRSRPVSGRPAQLYRAARDGLVLNPPLTRTSLVDG